MKNLNFKRIKRESAKEYNDRIYKDNHKIKQNQSQNKTKTLRETSNGGKLEKIISEERIAKDYRYHVTPSQIIIESEREKIDLRILKLYGINIDDIKRDQILALVDIIIQLRNYGSNYIPKSLDDGKIHHFNLLIKLRGIEKEARTVEEAEGILEYADVEKALKEFGCGTSEIPKFLDDAKDKLANIRQNELKPDLEKIQKNHARRDDEFDELKRKWDIT